MGGRCPAEGESPHFNLGLFHYEDTPSGTRFRFDRNLLPLPDNASSAITLGDGSEIVSAYDPHTMQFEGELWVAFECAGFDHVSACMAPLDPSSYSINQERAFVAVRGIGGSSASVPKLLAYRGYAYIYWTNWVRNNGETVSLVARGARLHRDGSAANRLVPGESWRLGSPMDSRSPESVVVLDVDPNDVTSNDVADISDILVRGDTIFISVALGGHGNGQICDTPANQQIGCYRWAMSRALEPLAPNGFRRFLFELPQSDEGSHEYSRFLRSPMEPSQVSVVMMLAGDSWPGRTGGRGFRRYDMTHVFEERSFEGEIRNLYRNLLLREPDPAGSASWLNAIRSGADFESLRSGFVFSAECSRLCKERFVVMLYREILERDPDPSGLRGLTDLLESGSSIGQVRAVLDQSNEYRELKTRKLYQSYLGRDADPEGLHSFVTMLGSGRTWNDIRNALSDSQEFRTRAVRGYYQIYLHRDPDPDGLSGWLSVLNTGQTLDDVRRAITRSPEANVP